MTTQTAIATEVILEGRIVCGHPMTRRPVKMKQRGEAVETQVFQADGITPVTDIYVGMAIPKGAETHWNQTPWGQLIYNRAVQDFPAGQHASPTFSWKVMDGDSQVPNKKLKKPCDREGWPGHWVIHASTRLGVRSHHNGKYAPEQQIQVEAEIKTGDYGRLFVGIKGNTGDTPGVYVNPIMFSLDRAGQVIVSESGPAAQDVFAPGQAPAHATGVAPPVPGVAPPVPGVAPPVPGVAVVPAPEFLNVPAPPVDVKYLDANGNAFTEAQLIAAGFAPTQIQALQRA